MKKNKLLFIGKIVGVHGLKGALKVLSYAESSSVFEPGMVLYLEDSRKRERTAYLEWIKPHGKTLLFSLEGISDRNQAETLVGNGILIDRSNLPEPDDGEFFWEDLIGLSVIDAHTGDIGRLHSIIQTGSNDVYVVRKGKKETLVPALESVVLDIDLKQGTMSVKLPEIL